MVVESFENENKYEDEMRPIAGTTKCKTLVREWFVPFILYKDHCNSG